MVISAIILAAGEGRRFGELKQIYKINNVPILQTIIDKVVPLFSEVILVLGYKSGEILLALNIPKSLKVVVNPHYSLGMGTSLSYGVNSLSPSISHFAIFLSDMPHIEVKTVNVLVDNLREKEKEIIAPLYNGKRGFPVFFSYHFINDLKDLKGDRGARDLIKRQKKYLRLIRVFDPGVIKDIDTKKDL